MTCAALPLLRMQGASVKIGVWPCVSVLAYVPTIFRNAAMYG